MTKLSDEDINLTMQESCVLQQLMQLFEHHSLRLYRDDVLAILKVLSGANTERVKKKIIEVFKQCRLKVTIIINFYVVNL